MITELGGQALAVRCDVTRSEDVQAALNQAVATFGSLDVAFNNAGAEQKPSPTADVTEEEWDKIIAINLPRVPVHEVRDSIDARAWGRDDVLVLVPA